VARVSFSADTLLLLVLSSMSLKIDLLQLERNVEKTLLPTLLCYFFTIPDLCRSVMFNLVAAYAL
jgi:hypothetical protein